MRPVATWLLVGAVLAGSAQAQGLEGATIRAEWRFPGFFDVFETHDVTVGANVELPPEDLIDDAFGIDLGDQSVRFDFARGTQFSAKSFNGWHFQDLSNSVDDVQRFYIAAVSYGVMGLHENAVGYDTNSFWVSLSGVQVADTGDFILLRLIIPQEVFANGFESGSTGGWSSSQP